MRKRNKLGNNSSPNSYQSVSELIRAYNYFRDCDIFGKVNKNDGALLADLKRGIRRWCEPDIIYLYTLEAYIANNMDPDQTAPLGAV